MEQASTIARQAEAQIRQCSDMSACCAHSAAQASPIAMHAVIIDVITLMS